MTRFLGEIVNELHDRTPSDLVISDRVVLVGAGGVGTWTAVALALSADPDKFKLVIVDDDVLEVSNLNRLPYPLSDALVGRKKAGILYDYIKALRPMLQVSYVDKRIETLEDIAVIAALVNPTVIVDAVDNPASIKLLKDAAAKLGISYLGLHYDGTSVTIEWLPESILTDWIVDETPGYTVFPSCAFTPMFIASIAALILAVKPRRRLLLSCDLRKSLEETGH